MTHTMRTLRSRSLRSGLLMLAALGWPSVALQAAEPATAPATRPAQTPVLADESLVKNDLPYGGPDAALNVLDLYAPAKTHNAPVVIFIHGGEWARGDKRDVSTKPRFFNNHGMLFLSANYRLAPRYHHPAQVDDVAQVVAWAKANVAAYGGDPDKIVLMGHSAGCHLVTLTALDPRPLAKVGLKPADIRGVVAWSGGMYDLVDRYKAGGMYKPFIESNFGEAEAEQKAGSPITYVSNAAGGPRFLFATVTDPKSGASRQATLTMAAAVRAAGGQAEETLLVGKTHFTANHEVGAAGDDTGQKLLEFIRDVTAPRKTK